MKQIALILALMMLMACFTACAKKAEEPVEYVTTDAGVVSEEPAISGGWTLNPGMGENITADDRALIEQALQNYDGITVKPVALLGTQVVAGTNFAFLCQTAPVVPNAQSSLSVVVIYKDLEGNATITDVKDFNLTEYVSEEKSASTEQLAGGWTVNESIPVKAIEGSAGEAFEKAFGELVGASHQPVELLATQVVAGTNYAYLCKTTLVTAEPVTKLTIVTVYADLEGNASITAISDISIADILG